MIRAYNFEDVRLNQQFDEIISFLKKTGKAETQEDRIVFVLPIYETIQAFKPVSIDGRLAKNEAEFFNRIIGISLDNLSVGYGRVLHKGIITNILWNFTGEFVYVAKNGELIDFYVEDNAYFTQIIGKVLNKNTILVDIQPAILL